MVGHLIRALALVAMLAVAAPALAASGGPLWFGTGACLAGGPVPPTPKTIVGANATNIQTGTSYTVAAADQCKLNKFTNAAAVAVSLPVFPDKWMAFFEARGAGGVTLTPSSGTIEGQSAWTIPKNTGFIVFSDGTDYHVFGNTSAAAAALTNSHIFVGNASNLAADVAMSGDCTIANTGAITCSKISGTTVTFPLALSLGGTHADLSATGGAHQFVKQSSAGADLSVGTITAPDLPGDIAYLDVADQTVSGGANLTSQSQSTGNITVDCGSRPGQYITNGGAFTITAPSNDGYCYLDIENNGSAGAVSLSGFSPNTMGGATLDTTNGHNFRLMVSRVHGHANIFAIALQ